MKRIEVRLLQRGKHVVSVINSPDNQIGYLPTRDLTSDEMLLLFANALIRLAEDGEEQPAPKEGILLEVELVETVTA